MVAAARRHGLYVRAPGVLGAERAGARMPSAAAATKIIVGPKSEKNLMEAVVAAAARGDADAVCFRCSS